MMPALVVLACAGWLWRFPRARPVCEAPRPFAARATLAIALVLTRPFPLPTALDRRTADAFYAFVKEHTRRSGGPILAMRPELAYFVVGQPVEMEGSTFVRLALHNVAGSELLLQRLREGRYTLLVELHALPERRLPRGQGAQLRPRRRLQPVVLLRDGGGPPLHAPGPAALLHAAGRHPLRRARRSGSR